MTFIDEDSVRRNIKWLNRLLRGEMAAIETYRQALDQLGDEPGSARLKDIEAEHRNAANLLRQQIAKYEAVPSPDSGPWGVWTKVVEGAAKLFGNRTAVQALKEWEVLGKEDYTFALNDPDLDLACKSLIKTTLIPQCEKHIDILDKFVEVAA